VEGVRFRTADEVELEGAIRLPEGPPRGSTVVCHAHPRFGGSKDHPVLWQIRIALARGGLAVLSFNFRGTMGSGGEHGGGMTELEDVRAAVTRIRDEAPGPTLVCGWSFGANVALREALDDDRVAALALVAMPLSGAGPVIPPLPEGQISLERPVLLVAGDADPYCPVPDLRALAARIPGAEVAVLEGTDHYFGRRERELGELIARFAERVLFPGGPGR
jgi:hypothetical protein